MKVKKSNKKTVTMLSLAMVLALPLTIHADEGKDDNLAQQAKYSKLEEKIDDEKLDELDLETKEEDEKLEETAEEEEEKDLSESLEEADSKDLEEAENEELASQGAEVAEAEENPETDTKEEEIPEATKVEDKEESDIVEEDKEEEPSKDAKEPQTEEDHADNEETSNNQEDAEDQALEEDTPEANLAKEVDPEETEEDKETVINLSEADINKVEEILVDAGAEITRAPRDISKEIQNPKLTIIDNDGKNKIVKAFDGEEILWSVSFTAPEDIIPGDYFDINLSDNWSLQGIEPYTDYADPVVDKNDNTIVLAEGKRENNQKIRYTFTEDVRDRENIEVTINGRGYDRKEVIKNTGNQIFDLGLGDLNNKTNTVSQNLYIDYGVPSRAEKWNANGKNQFTYWDAETGEFTQVFYINPDRKEIMTNPYSDNPINMGLVLSAHYINEDEGQNNQQVKIKYSEQDTKITVQTVQRVGNPKKLPDAVYENPDVSLEDANKQVVYTENGDAVINLGSYYNDTYVVTVKSTTPIDAKNYTLMATGLMVGDPSKQADFTLGNGVRNIMGSATGTSDIQQNSGSFQEHHIYQTVDREGNVISTDDTDHGSTTQGTTDESYSTARKDREGYKLVSVSGTNGAKFNTDGSSKSGNYIAKTKQEVTYIYHRTKEDPKPEVGSFQDHHIYQTVDSEGHVISTDDTTHGKATEGTVDESYTTSKIDKEGYKLVSVSGENGAKYDTNGGQTTGNYIANTKQEVTYIYQKVDDTTPAPNPNEETGSFQDHHIYRTVDKDGKVISTDYTSHGQVKKGTTDQTYTTSKIDKEGYTLVKVSPTNGATANTDGSEATDNFIANQKQEVTYIYHKTQAEDPKPETGSFQDHHFYRTVDKDGNVISTDKTSHGEVQRGAVDKTYTTEKKDMDGYHLVEVSSTNGASYSNDGSETNGNFVANTKQEVTYIYVKVKEDPKKEVGSFVEHHIYRTVDKNGKIISTDKETHSTVSEGTEDETYTTTKKDEAGYKLVRVTTSNGAKANNDGSTSTANYIVDTKLEVTYIYERVKEDPKPETGSFQDHHIYIIRDEYGREISREVVDTTETSGKKDESYRTGRRDRDGYRLARIVRPVNNPSYDPYGNESSGNYQPGKKVEITYVYEKIVRTERPNPNPNPNPDPNPNPNPTPEPNSIPDPSPSIEEGSFQDHHIYIVRDKDGKEIRRELISGSLRTGGKDDIYITSKAEKDGYKLVRIENPINNPSYDEDGDVESGKFKPGVKKEITYVYEKIVEKDTETPTPSPVEEKGKFQETHIYIIRDKDGKEIGRQVVEGREESGDKEDKYTTGKKDKDGYKLIKVENPVNNPAYDPAGSETSGSYQPGVKKEITYVYEKIAPGQTDDDTMNPSVPTKPSTPRPSVNPPSTNPPSTNPPSKSPQSPMPPTTKTDNPKTGIGTSSSILVTLMAASASYLGLNKKRKED